MLNVSSNGCNNERQSFAKLSYSAIDNVLTNLRPAGLHDFFQVLNVANASFVNSFNRIVETTAFPLSQRKLFYHSKRSPILFQLETHELNALSSLVNGCNFICINYVSDDAT